MVISDKLKGQLARRSMALTFDQIGRDIPIPTFADTAGIANLIVQSGVEYDTISIAYNKFLSAISYEPVASVSTFPFLLANYLPAGFRAYEMEDDFTKDPDEFFVGQRYLLRTR